MKSTLTLIILSLLISNAAHSQNSYPTKNMVMVPNDNSDPSNNSITVYDGLITSEKFVEMSLASHVVLHDPKLLRKYGVKFITVFNSSNSPFESYVYGYARSKNKELKYKVPIIINGSYVNLNSGDYNINKAKYNQALNALNKKDIKSISYIPNNIASQKYDSKLIFGAIDIKTK